MGGANIAPRRFRRACRVRPGRAAPPGARFPAIALNSTRKLIRVAGGSCRPIRSQAARSDARRSIRSASGVGVGCQTAANRAARRSAASLKPPIQTGGCGCCSGLGLTYMSENAKNLPVHETAPAPSTPAKCEDIRSCARRARETARPGL